MTPTSTPPFSQFLEEQSPIIHRALVTAFLENVPDLVYFKDTSSRFIAVSKSKARRHGCDAPAELVGKSDRDFFSAQHAEATFAEEAEVMRAGIPIVGRCNKIVWADGHITWARTSKLPLRDERGEIIGTFGITQDITDQRRAEDALECTRKELLATSRLAGMAEAPTPTFASGDDDAERLVTLAKQLTAVPSRELAYSIAHLLTISDVAIAPEEDELLVDLRTALEITEDRAEELARVIGSAITPPS